MITQKKIEGVLTTADVMARLRVSRKTLYVLVAKHLPNAARIGREYRFIEADIETIWNGMRSGAGGFDGIQRSSGALQVLLAKKRKARR